jgi:Uma2 family endonuclease
MSVIQQAGTGALYVPGKPVGQHYVLENISWQTYERILADQGNHRLRHTYDRGQLELMTISLEHGTYSFLLGSLILVLAEELHLRAKGVDPVTCRREDVQRGLEPDKCFYVGNAHLISGRRQIDLSRDPPPDLALEIDISPGALDRMAVYAALRVPEVWCFDGQTLRAYRLGPAGSYEPCAQSRAFPILTVVDLLPFLQRGETQDDVTVLREFRAWVREHILPHWQGGNAGA